MPRGQPSPKLTITVGPEVHHRLRMAASKQGVSVSAWMTEAARHALHRLDGLMAIAEWEARHGRLNDEEMHQARRRVRAQARPRPARTARSA